jgi:segregation and condensation protein A
MTETSYKVKAGEFEGPLEVLLNLIEKRKLFINEISLASITDDFIVYVQNLDKKDIDVYASFISVAATLILIKSRSLIPNLELTVDEEHDVNNLEHRLELYKLIKEIGVEVEAKFGKQIIFPRLETKLEMKVFAPDKSITKDSMFAGIKDVIKAIPEEAPVKPEVTVMKIRSLEDTIKDLVERVSSKLKMSFREFSGNVSGNEKEVKVNVIVNFLAMLELVRNGFIDAFQENHFEDISLEKLENRSE